MVMNQPRPPSGLIYNEWTESHVIDGFKYKEEMTGRIAIDWGFRKPSVLIMVYDEEREATVIINEINPQVRPRLRSRSSHMVGQWDRR